MTIFRFPIEFGHVLSFRRALGYPDGSALDDDPSSLVVPPTFMTAGAQFDPDYRLRPRPGQAWITGGTGEESPRPANNRMMHAEQHYEYHAEVRPGQTLFASTHDGETWTKEGRAGTLTFSELLTEYRDEKGALVVTGRAVRVLLPPRADS